LGLVLELGAGHQAGQSALDRVGVQAEGQFLIAAKAVAEGEVAGVDVVSPFKALAGDCRCE